MPSNLRPITRQCMCECELPTSRLAKVIVWHTDRHTNRQTGPKLFTCTMALRIIIIRTIMWLNSTLCSCCSCCSCFRLYEMQCNGLGGGCHANSHVTFHHHHQPMSVGDTVVHHPSICCSVGTRVDNPLSAMMYHVSCCWINPRVVVSGCIIVTNWTTHRVTGCDSGLVGWCNDNGHWSFCTRNNSNCNCNWGTCIVPPTRRPMAHHRVNPYPGARKQYYITLHRNYLKSPMVKKLLNDCPM